MGTDNLSQSMDDALAALEAQASEPDVEQGTDLGKALEFELFQADEEIGPLDDAIDLNDLVKSFADVNDRNVGRLANMTGALINLVKSQSSHIEVLSSKIGDVERILDQVASAPNPVTGARNADEAAKLAKSLETPRFSEGEAPFSEGDRADVSATFGAVKHAFVSRLQEQYEDSFDQKIGDDLMKSMGIPALTKVEEVTPLLSPAGRKIFRELTSEEASQ